MNPIIPASSIPPAGRLPGATQGANVGNSQGTQDTQGGAGGFAKLFDHLVQQTNNAQVTSDQSIDDLVKGKTNDVQQVVMAVANAEMSFQLFMEIRNKLIDSYNELMRMQF